MADKKTKGQSKIAEPRSQAEWISLVVSALLVAVVVGMVIWLWVSQTGAPPQFELEAGETQQEGDAFALPVTITNTGDTTAVLVLVEGELTTGEETLTAETTFELVTAGGSAEGVLYFDDNPTNATLRVVSYQLP